MIVRKTKTSITAPLMFALLAVSGCSETLVNDTDMEPAATDFESTNLAGPKLQRKDVEISEDGNTLVLYSPDYDQLKRGGLNGRIHLLTARGGDRQYEFIRADPIVESCSLKVVGVSPSATNYIYSCALFSSNYVNSFHVCGIANHHCASSHVRSGGVVSPVFITDDELLVFVFGGELVLQSQPVSQLTLSERFVDDFSSFGKPTKVSVVDILKDGSVELVAEVIEGQDVSFLYPLPIDRVSGGAVLVKYLSLLGAIGADQRSNEFPGNGDVFGPKFAVIEFGELPAGFRVQPLATDRVDWIAPDGGVLALNEDATGFVGATSGQLNSELGLLGNSPGGDPESGLEFFDFSGRFFVLVATEQSGEANITVCEFSAVWRCGGSVEIDLAG